MLRRGAEVCLALQIPPQPIAPSTEPQWQPASAKQFSCPVAGGLRFLTRWFSLLRLKLVKDNELHIGNCLSQTARTGTKTTGRLLLRVVNMSYHGLFFDLKWCSCAVRVVLSVRVVYLCWLKAIPKVLGYLTSSVLK